MQRHDHRVAVVGGAGFIGSHLVERLQMEGHSVLVIGRKPGPSHACRTNTRFVAANICSREAIGSVLAQFRPHTVYHLAAASDARESAAHVRTCLEVNTVGAMNVFEAASESGASLFVYGDSSKNYGNGDVPYRSDQMDDPICSYAVAKAAAWRLMQIAAEGGAMKICSIRPTIVYGPRQPFCLVQYVYECFRRGEPVRLQGGKQTRDLLYVQDAADAFYNVMASPGAWGNAIPIGGGRELPVSDWCRIMLDMLGSSLEVIVGADQPRRTEIWRSYCDNIEASKMLGWNPRYSIADGFRELYPEARKHAPRTPISAMAGA